MNETVCNCFDTRCIDSIPEFSLFVSFSLCVCLSFCLSLSLCFYLSFLMIMPRKACVITFIHSLIQEFIYHLFKETTQRCSQLQHSQKEQFSIDNYRMFQN